MGTVIVDQIAQDATLIHAPDHKLSERNKNALLLAALPSATAEDYSGVRVVRFQDQVILKKQVTHLGNPWPAFKKRIQIPNKWLAVEEQARAAGLTPRFVGIYHHQGVTIFVDFDPTTYATRKANNSAAHVATNDLYQAQIHGAFSRTDGNGNRLTSVRADLFSGYLTGSQKTSDPRKDALEQFNRELIGSGLIQSLDAVKQMHAVGWTDTMQAEWAGFYLEFRLDTFLRKHGLTGLVEFQKDKKKGAFDFDLVFKDAGTIDYYGDLKASNVTTKVSPGNDAADIKKCVNQYGRFWYVICEHDTMHARDNQDLATIAWNQWRLAVGHTKPKAYDELSYAKKFKESVRFVGMKILEVNPANFDVVLGSFAQGVQPSGADRALKVMIRKKNIDNFLIYSESI